MALYQPTNIYPDLKGGVQNGVILLPYSGTINDVEVSWTVNGNSPMTDYKIDFYTNDAASTLTGTRYMSIILPRANRQETSRKPWPEFFTTIR